jgi:hypothetical protein
MALALTIDDWIIVRAMVVIAAIVCSAQEN